MGMKFFNIVRVKFVFLKMMKTKIHQKSGRVFELTIMFVKLWHFHSQTKAANGSEYLIIFP
jgi:hypothetical protein